VFIDKIVQNILRLFCLFIGFTASFEATAQDAQSKHLTNQPLPVCLYIASYSPGYVWQNGVTRGVNKTLDGKCHLKTFFMNTKKTATEADFNNISLQVVDFIATNKPDVVIISDDNAVKYVLQKYYKNSKIPFVFCGVNNTAKNYDLPYKNTTGMIEKAPVKALLKLLFDINPSKTRIAMLTTQGTSADSDAFNFIKVTKNLGIKSQVFQAKDEQEWRKFYKQIQEGTDFDLLFLSNRATFKTWDHHKNYSWALKYDHKLTFTSQDWMVPYAAIGLTKKPDEQGIWAAKAALSILEGVKPNHIAIVPNQNFQFWVNKELAEPFKELLPEKIFTHSLIYNESLIK